jgi:very-short-patch-repair endonuclease
MDADTEIPRAPNDPPAEPAEAVSATLRARLDDARQELLDLTARNRLLNTPRRPSRSSSVEVLDELGVEVFRILVAEGREMTFLARPGEPDSAATSAAPQADEGASEESPDVLFVLPQPEDDVEDNSAGPAARHTDARLQTGMTSTVLQRRLLRLFHDARTYQEEQGVNILFLAIGFLRWYESDSSDQARHAPLILVPVELDRRSARSRFRVRWTGEEVTTNLSLKVKQRAEFGIDIPDLPTTEEIDPAEYFEQVRAAVSHMPRWEVLADDIVLWFFSFAKLLMYLDLDPEKWPAEKALTDRPLVRALLERGFRDEPPLVDEHGDVDEIAPPEDALHVMDADSSQALVIEEAKRGRNLIVQGPPGTGKSQTIANIIAAAVSEGKKVLFLAEKMAALDVVKRRLDAIGVGDMCLELHSNKARKREVIAEVERIRTLGRPLVADASQTIEQLREARLRLTEHSRLMHTPDETSGRTPYRVIGELVRLTAAGVPPADFALADGEAWSGEDVRQREEQLRELVRFVNDISTPCEHPWRGVQAGALLPSDRQRIIALAGPLLERLQAFRSAVEDISAALRCRVSHTPRQIRRLARIATRLADAPELDGEAHVDRVWNDLRRDIVEVVNAGRRLTASREIVGNRVIEQAWTMDLAQARMDLAAFGRSFWRWLSGPYRRAQAQLRGIMTQPVPKSLDDRLALLDALIDAKAAAETITTAHDLGRRAFGRYWNGVRSDWKALAAIEAWDRACMDDKDVPDGFRSLVKGGLDRAALKHGAAQITSQLDQVEHDLDAICAQVHLDVSSAFGEAGAATPLAIDDLDFADVEPRLAAWRAEPDAVSNWIAYRLRDEAARALGLGELCDQLYSGRISADGALPRFLMAYHELLMRRMFRDRPALAAFNGLSHEQVLERFRQLDQRRIELARQEVALGHYQQIPRGSAAIGEVGVIRRESQKRRRHMPIRQLLKAAGNAATSIKPVFMMSPMSIAQFVEPGALEFDLLVIDEASQVRPVDALGAAARAKQMVVVGDERQLPPTRFFSRSMDDYEPDEVDAALEQRAGDLESVLGLCHAQGMPDRMLRWHYRSRHHSLIAVSNRELYDSRLYIVPSPARGGDEIGVIFRHITGGIYDRGASATNRIEARAIAEAVMRHAREQPKRTLGVGAFSVRQRDAILDELEQLRRELPEHEPFFASGSAEPFFVKNLENVQGDERDVIFISIGFGRDVSGYMSMHFGPVSNEGGERRLNVLITRARQRCEVFSSITWQDIDLNRATGRGPQVLKAFLKYAQMGVLDVGMPTGRDPDSVFEEAVAKALRDLGWPIDHQVGIAGFFIDLAVKDPDQPGRYLLGIECDGAAYHSSRSARDRDRIRQQVLEDRGWSIHRIWSTDWFNHPQEQLRKAVAAIEKARARGCSATSSEPEKQDGPSVDTQVKAPIVRREEAEEEAHDEASLMSEAYEEAVVRVPRHMEIHQTPLPRLRKIVEQIVRIEGPVHSDEVAQRVTALWGLQRAGSRIRAAVAEALCAAEREGRIRADDGFVFSSGELIVRVRNRAEVESASLRRPEMLPPAEIDRCLELLVESHFGVIREEAVIACAREFGFRSTSSQLREAILRRIEALIARGRLVDEAGALHRPTSLGGDDVA